MKVTNTFINKTDEEKIQIYIKLLNSLLRGDYKDEEANSDICETELRQER